MSTPQEQPAPQAKQQVPKIAITERPKAIVIHNIPPISLKTQVQNVHRKIEEQVLSARADLAKAKAQHGPRACPDDKLTEEMCAKCKKDVLAQLKKASQDSWTKLIRRQQTEHQRYLDFGDFHQNYAVLDFGAN